MKRIFLEIFTVCAVGAIGYGTIEVSTRGHSHITMALLGGAAMIVIHFLNDDRRSGAPLLELLAVSALFITACELLAGEILNVWLGLHIWSYSKTPFNFDGVICLRYTICWALLSMLGFIVDDLIRWKIFGHRCDFRYLKTKRACSA